MSGGKKTEGVKDKAIACLLECGSVKDSAARCKISTRTLTSWLADDADFKRRYKAARRRLLDDALLLLERASRSAVAALLRATASDDPSVSLKGAQALLDQVLRVGGYLDLEERVSSLEQREER